MKKPTVIFSKKSKKTVILNLKSSMVMEETGSSWEILADISIFHWKLYIKKRAVYFARFFM